MALPRPLLNVRFLFMLFVLLLFRLDRVVIDFFLVVLLVFVFVGLFRRIVGVLFFLFDFIQGRGLYVGRGFERTHRSFSARLLDNFSNRRNFLGLGGDGKLRLVVREPAR
jgi:hypothetical protein